MPPRTSASTPQDIETHLGPTPPRATLLPSAEALEWWQCLTSTGPAHPYCIAELLCPVDQLVQLVNWATFLMQYVNIYHLINWTAIDKWQMTYGQYYLVYVLQLLNV
jgi:hypothetical protein